MPTPIATTGTPILMPVAINAALFACSNFIK
jgi:hypothetical protein